jgi:hypothetical protein
MLVHLLQEPLGRDPQKPGRVIWELTCSRKVSLNIDPRLVPGAAIQMPDPHGAQAVECAMCFNAKETQEEPSLPPDNMEATLDESLGDLSDDTLMGYDDGGEVIKEEHVDYPDQ